MKTPLLKGLYALVAWLAVAFAPATVATPYALNFNSQGYGPNSLESSGFFTWTDIGGSGIDLTWTLMGNTDVNDSPSGSNLRLGINDGASDGVVHQYLFTFSAPVKWLEFDIRNINQGNQGGFRFYDLLTFSGNPNFVELVNGVTSSGNTLIPAVGGSDGERARIFYDGYLTGVSISHGGGPNNVNPGFIRFGTLTFHVPEPAPLLLIVMGLLLMTVRIRRQG